MVFQEAPLSRAHRLIHCTRIAQRCGNGLGARRKCPVRPQRGTIRTKYALAVRAKRVWNDGEEISVSRDADSADLAGAGVGGGRRLHLRKPLHSGHRCSQRLVERERRKLIYLTMTIGGG